MNYETEQKLAKEFYEKCQDILVNKAHDYASSSDCFSNFKTISETCVMPIEKVFLMFITVKIARLVELTGSKKLNACESISDSLKDIANYACLMHVYLNDNIEEEKSA